MNLCPCGCGGCVRPGNKFHSSGCSSRGRKLTLSPEQREARAAKMRRYNRTPAARAKLAELNATASARMSARNRKSWQDPAYRAKQTQRIKTMQPKLAAAKQKRMQDYWADPENRAAQSERSLAQWQDPEFRRRFYRNWLRSFSDRTKPSRPHCRLKAALVDAGLSGFETHVTVGHYCLDEADVDRKIAVEVNGCYWHACPDHLPANKLTKKHRWQMSQDRRKRTYLERRGWVVVAVWEHELDDMDTVVRSIADLTEEVEHGKACIGNRH